MKKFALIIGSISAVMLLVGSSCATNRGQDAGSGQTKGAAAPAAEAPMLTEADRTAVPESPSRDQLLGGDRDEHGCIGSAGYTWCEAKSKCLRSWEENCFVSAEEGVSYALADKYGKPVSDIHVTIGDEQGGFARGDVRFEPWSSAGGMFLAYELNGHWLLAYDGNGSVDCAKMRDEFGFPEGMLKGFCDAE